MVESFDDLSALVNQKLREIPLDRRRLLLRQEAIQWMSVKAIHIDLK